MKDKRSVLLFKYHRALIKNTDYSKILIDEFGRKTDESNAKEIILHNV